MPTQQSRHQGMGLINIVSEVFGLQDVVGTVVLSALPYGLISASGR